MTDYLTRLRDIVNTHNILHYVEPVLTNKDFVIGSGSGHPSVHHYGDGGLLRHTYEVTELCLINATTINSYIGSGVHSKSYPLINIKELLISAIWHDFGKIKDYEKLEDERWIPTPNKYKVYHITESVLAFMQHYSNMPPEKRSNDISPTEIIHNILAHHGRHEWKSPATPKTKAAWVLHLCDNMSARTDDCDVQFQESLDKYKK